MTTIRSSFFISGAVIALIIIAPLVALAAWGEPSQAPTGGNVDPPINTGSGNQVKNGGLSVNTLAVFGSTAINGNTYLKTGVTGSIYRYLNFGVDYDVDGNVIASTIEASGYGIRDKDGTLEFKNLGGSWASIQSTVNALAGMWVTSGSNIYNTNTGNVGIGTANPVARLEVVTPFRISRGDASGHAGYEFGQESDDIGLDLMYFNTATHLYSTIAIFGYDGSVGFGMRGTGSGYKVAVNGSIGATGFNNISDQSLKTNVHSITGALRKVMQLKGVSFNWKDPKQPEPQIGFIAQDVEKIVPEVTSTNGNTGLKSVDYGRVMPLLVEALKEQQKEIENLKDQLAELKDYAAFSATAATAAIQ